MFATTLSDSKSSNSNTEGECNSEGYYRAFMAIASFHSKDDLRNLVDEFGNLSKDEKVEESEDEDVCQNEGENNLHAGRLWQICQSCKPCCEKDKKGLRRA